MNERTEETGREDREIASSSCREEREGGGREGEVGKGQDRERDGKQRLEERREKRGDGGRKI